MIKIRSATVSDIDAFIPLMEQLGYHTSKQELQARFERFIKNDGYGVAIASSNDQIIGFVAWSKSYLFLLDKCRFHIEGLVVDEHYRGLGAGKKLMLFVEAVASTSGPSIIDLTSGVRRANDGSHGFYKSLGYKNEGSMAKLYLRKEIE